MKIGMKHTFMGCPIQAKILLLNSKLER